MKKQTKAPAQGKPPAASSPSGSAKNSPEKTKIDLSLPAPAVPAPKKSSDKGISKSYLSKSQDNLASALRRKAAVAALSQNKDTPSTPRSESRNNSGNNKDKTGTIKVPKPVKQLGNPIRKAHSTQNIDRAGTPIKRASSVQNVNVNKTTAPPTTPVKKAASTQNISKGPKSGTRQRISAPADIMAYNAELLASFEKEKKALERRISELIQITESRKTEIEKYKFEIRNLKETIPQQSVQEELDMLRSENRLLKDRLQELGVTVEQITDNEKLSMRQNAASSVASDEGGPVRSEESSGATAKILLPNQTGPDLTLSMGDLSCGTPDHPSLLSLDNSNWDKQSNKSSDAMSEVSVACLQDRIQQMEETHYSTNEELQVNAPLRGSVLQRIF